MRRFLGILSLVLGLLGMGACLAGAYGFWQAASEARQVNRQLADVGRAGLDSARGRIRRVGERVGAAHMDGVQITKRIQELTKQEAREQIAEQLQLEHRVDLFNSKVATADAWLETTNDTLTMVQKILKLSHSPVAGQNAEKIAEISQIVGDVRGELGKAQEQLQVVRNFGKEVDGESFDQRIARILRLLKGVVAATGLLDSRLEQASEGLLQLRERTTIWEQQIDIAIQRTLAVALLILAWIAVGQWCLFRSGLRRSFRSSR